MSWSSSSSSSWGDGDDWSNSLDNEDEMLGEDSLVDKNFFQKDALILLIDCSSSMVQLPKASSSGEPWSQFQKTIHAVARLMKDKIIANDSSKLGVAFYNTLQMNNAQQFAGIHVFQSLDELSAQRIKDVEALADPEVFQQLLGSTKQEGEFYNTLWVCSTLFSEDNSLKQASKRIFLFTDNDDPNSGNSELRDRIVQKAHDLDQLGIELELFALYHQEGDFQEQKFWLGLCNGLVKREDDDEGSWRIASFGALDDRLRMKEYKKRSLATVPLQIAPDLAISVKIYCLIRPATKGLGVFLHRETNDQLTVESKWVCGESGEVLEDHQFSKYFPYGNAKVEFTTEEMNTIKDFGPPGLQLMGFKSQALLKPYFNVRPPYFVYPDESRIRGSVVAFSALLQKMHEKGKMAIVRMIYRKRQQPYFAALLPQMEVRDELGRVVTPPGMHMVFMPYADDIRNLQFEKSATANVDLVVQAKKVVSSLAIQWQRNSIENPTLQKHYAALQALALNEPIGEVVDVLQPPAGAAERVDPHIKTLCEGVRRLIAESSPADADSDEDEVGSKRKRPTGKAGGSRAKKESGGEPAAKRGRAAASGGDEVPDRAEIVRLCESGELSKLVVPKLKAILAAHKLKVSGNKADLVERIEAHFA